MRSLLLEFRGLLLPEFQLQTDDLIDERGRLGRGHRTRRKQDDERENRDGRAKRETFQKEWGYSACARAKVFPIRHGVQFQAGGSMS